MTIFDRKMVETERQACCNSNPTLPGNEHTMHRNRFTISNKPCSVSNARHRGGEISCRGKCNGRKQQFIGLHLQMTRKYRPDGRREEGKIGSHVFLSGFLPIFLLE